MYRHIIICVQVFTGLIQSWIIKIRKDMRYVQLPSVEVPTQLRDEDVDFVVWCADIMVKIGAIWTGRKCFFRSYIIASVLRSWKIPVIINVGLCNLKVIDKTKGHCWLTLDGKPFKEIEDLKRKYPQKLGCSSNGVCYWVGS